MRRSVVWGSIFEEIRSHELRPYQARSSSRLNWWNRFLLWSGSVFLGGPSRSSRKLKKFDIIASGYLDIPTSTTGTASIGTWTPCIERERRSAHSTGSVTLNSRNVGIRRLFGN